MQYPQTKAPGSTYQLGGPYGLSSKVIREGTGLFAQQPHPFCKHVSWLRKRCSFGWFVSPAVLQETVKWDFQCYFQHPCSLKGKKLWGRERTGCVSFETWKGQGHFPKDSQERVSAEESFNQKNLSLWFSFDQFQCRRGTECKLNIQGFA